jgi:predicted nucleic acid-binding protein
MILLDTVVLSELRKPRPSPAVVKWLSEQSDSELFLSVVSLGEIERGIEKQRGIDPDFSMVLSRWLDDLLNLYGDRVLPISPPVARRWGILSARLGNDSADLLVAATAITHGLVVATRNVRHFEPTGVGVVNPFGNPGKTPK